MSGHKPGVYMTMYNNVCEYCGGDTAWDLDMREEIPVEMVDFDRWVRELGE